MTDVVARYQLKFKDLTSKGLTKVAATARVATKALAAASAAVVAVGAAAGVAAFKLANMFAQRADEIAKFTKETSFAADAMQRLEFVAERQGAEFQTVTKGISQFNRALGELRGGYGTMETALKKLNPALKEQLVTAESSQAAYFLLVREIAKLPDAADRAALAAAAVGQRGAKALLRITADGVGAIDALEKRAQFLRPAISDQALKAAEAYQDALTDVKTALGGLGDSVGASLLPRLTELLTKTADFIATNRDMISAKTIAFFDQLSSGIASIDFKQLSRDGADVVSALADILPIIAGVAREFSNLVGGPGNAVKVLFGITLVGAVGKVAAVIKPVFGLLSGLGSALAVVSGFAKGAVARFVAIQGVFTTLTAVGRVGLLPLLSRIPFLFGPIGIAIGLVITAGIALWKNWDTVKAKAQQLLSSLRAAWSQIQSGFSAAFQAVANVVSTVWDSIVGRIQRAIDRIKRIIASVRSTFGSFFDVGSSNSRATAAVTRRNNRAVAAAPRPARAARRVSEPQPRKQIVEVKLGPGLLGRNSRGRFGQTFAYV